MVADINHCINIVSEQVPLLMAGPCLVLALQRDNAVIAFDSLLGTSYVKDSVYSKYGAQILRPKDSKQVSLFVIIRIHMFGMRDLELKRPCDRMDRAAGRIV